MSIEKPIKPEWFEKDERISRLAMSAMFVFSYFNARDLEAE